MTTIFIVGKSAGSPCSSRVWTWCGCSPPGQMGNMLQSGEPQSPLMPCSVLGAASDWFPWSSNSCTSSTHTAEGWRRLERVSRSAAETLEEMKPEQAQTSFSQYPTHWCTGSDVPCPVNLMSCLPHHTHHTLPPHPKIPGWWQPEGDSDSQSPSQELHRSGGSQLGSPWFSLL